MELILFAMLSLIVIVTLLANRLNDNSFPFPFDRKQVIFTVAENKFQTLAEQAVGQQYKIVNRVKLADILAIRSGVSNKARQIAVNNANSKYVDFAICERNTMKLVGVIDMVDTQGKGYKVKKDWFVSGALEAASIPHIRIKVKASYNVDEIRACIESRMFGHQASAPKVKGRVIPAPLVKARSKNTGVVTTHAAKEQLNKNTPALNKLPSTKIAALPH